MENKSGETLGGDFENLEFSDLPEMKDSECQTRESLFSTQLIDSNSVRSFIPSLVVATDQEIHPKRTSNNLNKIPPFSTFGYARTDEVCRSGPEFPGDPRNQAFGLSRCYENSRSEEKRYKAEAVIEVESKKEDESSESYAVRPFSIDSTKSAPDVIVTH